MRQVVPATIATLILAACGGAQQNPASAAEAEPTTQAPEGGAAGEATAGAEAGAPREGSQEFVLQDSQTAKDAHGYRESTLKPTKTETVIKFIVVDKDKGPLQGMVILLTGPDGKKFYAPETDPEGYTEVLVPAGKTYELVYLSLGKHDVSARVPVPNEPNQNLKLTMRYKRLRPEPPPGAPSEEPGIVLDGVQFDTGKATIRPESLPRFDGVIEYLTHKLSARLEISGHTDNVGNPKSNKTLSQKRADACRNYLISKGIDAGRIEAVGYGDEKPIASNDTEAGRQENRRIEATER